MLLGAFLVGGSTWMLSESGPMSVGSLLKFGLADLATLLVLPVALLRWRLVLEPDELILVFLRVRRLPLQDIVEAKCVAGRGLVFVCRNGVEESTQLVGNTAWAHRRKRPTRADLLARAVLCAAADARGDAPPVDYRLAPTSGLKRAALKGGLVALIIGLLAD